MKQSIFALSSLVLLSWQLDAGAACQLKSVSKNIPGTIVSGYCSNNNDQVSCKRSVSKRWTCNSYMGTYGSMELGKAIADSCGCKWTPPKPEPEDNDNGIENKGEGENESEPDKKRSEILKSLGLGGLVDNDDAVASDNDNDENKDILDYFTTPE
jgi:hypothetical protein